MDPLLTYIGLVLASAGGNVALNMTSSALYDKLKAKLGGQSVTPERVEQEVRALLPHLSLVGISVVAEAAITLLAQNGDATISGTHFKTPGPVEMGSAPGTKLSWGNGSISTAGRSTMSAGAGMTMVAQGGAFVRQNPDGSVQFFC